MNVTPVESKRSVSSTQLLLAAGLALVMAIVGAKVYPFLVSFGVAGPFLTGVRASTLVCLIAALVLPITAIVRWLIR